MKSFLSNDIKTRNNQIDSLVNKATKGKFLKLQEMIDSKDVQIGLGTNEYLEALKNQIVRINTVNYLKVDIPLFQHFYSNIVGKVGDYYMERQIMLGRASEYSPYFDANDHYNPATAEQIMKTVFRKRFDLSLSADLIAAAFLSYGDMADFIGAYWTALSNVRKIYWQNVQMDAFMSIPMVYQFQNDDSDGKLLGKELSALIYKMGMPSTHFNIEGIPQAHSPEELILVLNSKYYNAIDIDAFGAMFRFGETKHAKSLKAIHVFDFPNADFIGCLLTENSFRFDTRIDESTNAKYARTLIEDNYVHDWMRAMRGNFSTTIAFYAKGATLPTKIENSPFTHCDIDNKGLPTKWYIDEPTVVDVTQYITSGTNDKLEIPTNMASYVHQNYTYTIDAAAETPTDVEIINAMHAYDRRLDRSKMTVTNITTTSARVVAVYPYVVNSFKDYVDIRYTVNVVTPTKNKKEDVTKVETTTSDISE